jgi:hypothetical protein
MLSLQAAWKGPGREMGELVSIAVAAFRTGYSDRKIRSLLRDGKITRYGRRSGTRVSLAELFEALQKEGQEPQQTAEEIAARVLGKRGQ